MKSNFFLVFYFFCLFSFLFGIHFFILEGIPHVPDSAAYFFMAKQFATGALITNIPISPPHFDFFPGILSIEQSTWLFQYPFGHPLLLSLGFIIGFPNIIPPLIGTLCIIVLFLIVRKLYGKTPAYFILLFPFISPFFIEHASEFMSHNSASLYLLLSFLLLLYGIETKKNYQFFLSGIMMGLLFNTRPLTSIPFLLLWIGFLLLKSKKSALQSLGYYLLGFFLLFLMYLIYNKITTQSFFHFQYFEINKSLLNQSSLTLFDRIEQLSILFFNFMPMLFNWNIPITIVLICIPLFLPKKNPTDYFLFLTILSLPLAYFFYNGTFLMYGPRFWYEITPFVFILVARTFHFFFQHNKLLTLSLICIFSLVSLGRFWGVLPTKNPDFFSPLSVKDLYGFNFVDNRIETFLKKQKITNAVIFINGCDNNWWCYGSVFYKNNPRLTNTIIYVKNISESENQKIIDYFSTKKYYYIDYYSLPPSFP